MSNFTLRINGKKLNSATSPDTPLLYVLRNEFQLYATKYGCGLGQCGSCAVLMDGKMTYSCLMPIAAVGEKEVRTLEGLAKASDKLHPVQEAFMEANAAQCGYCTSGMIMATVALLEENQHPSDDEISKALRGNLCRCGSHAGVLRAVKLAISRME